MNAVPLKRGWLLAFLIWWTLIVGGYALLFRYSFAVGKASPAPRTIPSSLAASVPLVKPQLFIALHPHCPCSRATVSELAKILSRATNSSDVTILMFKPAKEPDAWMEGTLLDQCRSMNCRIRPDPEGRLAASLGSLTSGQVVLYDMNRQLRYYGGITGSRGHEGDNPGEQAVIDILNGHRETKTSLPVFGCPIRREETPP